MSMHQNQPIVTAGISLSDAQVAMIMVHGRGATAGSIIELAHEFNQPDFAYLAPQATRNTWYPNRFTAPVASNEPYLSSALHQVGNVLAKVEQAGIPPEKTILLGFSQGACLALEFAARKPQRYGGVVALSGGLIGPPGTAFTYDGTLDNTPVFLGCSDVDFHIPLERVQESTLAMQNLDSDVTERIYPGMGHTVNQDEIEFVRGMMAALTAK